MIFVTETWGDTYTYFNLEGYNCAFANQGRGKGVGVFFKKDASIQKCEQDLFQFIKLRKETITGFCIYISKGCDFKKIDEFSIVVPRSRSKSLWGGQKILCMPLLKLGGVDAK